MKRRLLFCLAMMAAFVGPPALAEMPVLDLGVGLYRIRAEVAHTDGSRMTGLMHRTELADNAGMLFVFARTARHCMWMKNTLLPLSVAFIDDSGRIVNVEDMAPATETPHCAGQPVRYALETNKGWFSRHRLGPGTRVLGIERAPAPQ